MNFFKKQLHIILIVFVFSLLGFQLVLIFNVHKPVNGMERKAAVRELKLLFSKTWIEFIHLNQTSGTLAIGDSLKTLSLPISTFDSLLKAKNNFEVLGSDFSIEYELILLDENKLLYKGSGIILQTLLILNEIMSPLL